MESIKLTDRPCLSTTTKPLPIFRLRSNLFHKIFCILPEPFSAFSNFHSELCTFLVSLDFRIELLFMSELDLRYLRAKTMLLIFPSAVCLV